MEMSLDDAKEYAFATRNAYQASVRSSVPDLVAQIIVYSIFGWFTRDAVPDAPNSERAKAGSNMMLFKNIIKPPIAKLLAGKIDPEGDE